MNQLLDTIASRQSDLHGRDFLLTAWWIVVLPSFVIFVTSLAFSLLGDWLRDILDPTLRGN